MGAAPGGACLAGRTIHGRDVGHDDGRAEDVAAMISLLGIGRYQLRLAACEADLTEALALRRQAFGTCGADRDAFDPICTHVVIRERVGGRMVCCFRLAVLENGSDLSRSYSAQFYELSALEDYQGRMLELGRFCIRPGQCDPDILRLAWAALTRLVDGMGIGLLFGCSSFVGTETARYRDAFAMLKARHLAPARWLPRVKAPDVFQFAARLRQAPDARMSMLAMPPLLRSYLAMGGWVSDHAVVDREMNTLHVFTGLEVGAIPEGRRRLLRGLAGDVARA